MTSYSRMTPQARAIAYIALERYFVWSELMRHAADHQQGFQDANSSERLNSLRERTGQLFLRFHWITALVPVVEGWEKLRLSDTRINQLLYLDPLANPHVPVTHIRT